MKTPATGAGLSGRRGWMGLAWATALGMALPSGGCSVLSPAPTWEVVKAIGGAASLAMTTGGARASATVYQLHRTPLAVCIVVDPSLSVADLLPALQRELGGHAVLSRLVAAGAVPPSCSHWLEVTASAAWDSRPWESELQLVLRAATLTLRQADGRVLSHSRYDVGDGVLSGKWASTQQKLAPVVTALLTGFEN